MRSSRRLLVALLAGVIAAGLFVVLLNQAYSSRGNSGTNQSTQTNNVPTVNVVVANAPGANLPAGTQLTATNVRVAAIPNTQFVQNSNLVDSKQAVGQFISVGLPDGAPILQTFLLSAAPSASNSLTRAPLPIDPGQEAIGIPYDTTKDVGGYIQPGDRLDVLVQEPDGSVHYGFQDVPVLRVNAPSGTGANANLGTLVVELTPQKAATLGFLLQSAPTEVIRLVLRPASASAVPKLPNTNPVGGGNWQQFLDS